VTFDRDGQSKITAFRLLYNKVESVCQPKDELAGRHALSPRAKPALVVIGALLSMPLGFAFAATQVTGQQEDLQITAQNASIREIIEALSAKFNLAYKLPPTISGNLAGHYSGSLGRVLARILDGNDYILEILDSRVTVVVFGV